MASTPNFTALPTVELSSIGTANTNRDGTGTIATISTGRTGGRKINEVRVKATATTTAGMIRFFASVDSGTTWRLIHEIPVPVVAASASAESFSAVWTPSNLEINGTTNLIGASTHNAETFHVTVWSGELG